MIRRWQRLAAQLVEISKDENFLDLLHQIENIVAKVLSLALVVVIFVSLFDLARVLSIDLLAEPVGFFNKTLIQIFGLFLNVLIALELLENIAAYLRKHVIHVELVIVTSLIAVARKIIIFDFNKYSHLDLISLAVAMIALSASYWFVRRLNTKE
jgi:uncharacterized membrane protein (DUF373 family)